MNRGLGVVLPWLYLACFWVSVLVVLSLTLIGNQVV